MAEIDRTEAASGEEALSQPTRRRLLALLLGRGRATTPTLAAELGLHPNGVRRHLLAMHRAGLVRRERVQRAQGRPHDEWAAAPGASLGGDPPTAYAALSGWLAGSIPPTPARLREVEARGREVGGDLAPEGDRHPAAAIVDALSALGFEPEVELDDAGRLDCRLGNCPYRDSVEVNRDVVCTLHRGITRGLLDRVAAGAELTRFVPHDPRAAGCEVVIEGLPTGPI